MRRRAGAAAWPALPAAVFALTVLLFSHSLGNGFVDFDDARYVTANAMVRQGLNPATLSWAFTSLHAYGWSPLTWLSHLFDVTLWGLDPFGHHLSSVILHGLNAALLFLLLRGLTGALWRSLAVAILFAVHPLRVESVSWVAERKDVLSACLGFICLLLYQRHLRRPNYLSYASVLALFALGLMAKPMLVTLPALMLVLDWWPLGRLRRANGWAAKLRPALEKTPLFAMSAAVSLATFLAQSRGGAVFEDYPLEVRLANAVVSYARYLGKTFRPVGLFYFYRHPEALWPLRIWLSSLVLLLGATLAAFLLRRRRPYLLAGWLWFGGMLVPVIGLVQVGSQAMADRYTYLPLIGVAVALVWHMADLARLKYGRIILAACLIAAWATLSVLTWRQQGRWHDTAALTRGMAMELQPWVALNQAGLRHANAGRLDEAARLYLEATVMGPGYAPAWYNLGNSLSGLGKRGEAIEAYRRALRLNPDDASVHNNLAAELAMLGDLEEAAAHFREAARLEPDFIEAAANLRRVEERLKAKNGVSP